MSVTSSGKSNLVVVAQAIPGELAMLLLVPQLPVQDFAAGDSI